MPERSLQTHEVSERRNPISGMYVYRCECGWWGCCADRKRINADAMNTHTMEAHDGH